jgi:uncharacterized protein involved in outer membrane biogenesis
VIPRVPVQWRSLLAKAWWRRRRVWVPVLVLVLYALLGFVLAPALARHYLVQGVRESLGAELAIGELDLNPFLFRVEARDLTLREGNGAPLAALGGFVADFELSSLFRWAWTFAELRLEQPELDLVREADGRINLLRVLAALPPGEASADPRAPPPRALLQQADVLGARVRFTDQARARPAHVALGPIDLRFDEIATLHQHRGPYTLSATLPGGAAVDWEGHISLHPLASTGRMRLHGFEPRAVWDFAEGQLALAAPRGVIDAELGYELGVADGTLALRMEPVALAIRDLALQREGAPPLLELREAGFDGARLDLGARTVTVAQAWLRGGRLAAAMDRAGVLDWSTLVPAGASSDPPSPRAPAVAPWKVQLQSLALQDVAVEALDETRNAPLGISFATRTLALGADMAGGSGPTKIELSGIALELGDIMLSTGAERVPMGRIARLTVEDASADLQAQALEARRVGVEGLTTTIHRQADGKLREIVLASAPDPVQPLPVSAAAATWSAAIDELELSGLDVGFVDESTAPPLVYGTADGHVVLKDLHTHEATPVVIDARLPLDEGGTITLAGTAAGDGSSAALTARLDKLSLGPLAPLVARDTTLRLEGGVASSEATIDYQGGETPRVQAKATLGVDDFLLSEADSGERFLAWRALSVSGIELGFTPDHLQIKELRLLEPGAKIVVNKDRTTNLAAVMRRSNATGEPQPAPSEASQEPTAGSFPMSIGRVRIDGATVDFADHSLVLPFAARIEKLKGVANGISSADNSRATLKFSGRVGEFGEAEIDGQLAPFDPKRFTDIEVNFSNIGMTPFSPYSATFAGRTIAAGDLDLGLEYTVKDNALQGDNRVLLSNLRLGETVDSPDATDLPLDLAIALLTDAEGHIDLTLPVNGDVGAPSFSYGPLVMQALGNLLRGVVTAPFRALGGLFGGDDGEALQAVRFKSGSAELLPREQERVAKLAEALAARPQLGVELAPGTEAERDGYAARRLIVRRAHAELLDIELEPGEDPGPVSYDGAKSQRALEQLLEDRQGEEAADAFARAYADRTGREPERVNAALALMGQGEGEPEYYRELYLHLVKSTPEPAAELQALGTARVQAIRAALLARGVEALRVRDGTGAVLTPARPNGVLMPLTLVALD